MPIVWGLDPRERAISLIYPALRRKLDSLEMLHSAALIGKKEVRN